MIVCSHDREIVAVRGWWCRACEGGTSGGGGAHRTTVTGSLNGGGARRTTVMGSRNGGGTCRKTVVGSRHGGGPSYDGGGARVVVAALLVRCR